MKSNLDDICFKIAKAGTKKATPAIVKYRSLPY